MPHHQVMQVDFQQRVDCTSQDFSNFGKASVTSGFVYFWCCNFHRQTVYEGPVTITPPRQKGANPSLSTGCTPFKVRLCQIEAGYAEFTVSVSTCLPNDYVRELYGYNSRWCEFEKAG